MVGKNKDVYSATIRLFGPEPEPAFEESGRMERIWGRDWGCDSDVGRMRVVLMHRPGDEFNVIDRSKRIEGIGSFGDPDTGWYWQSEDIPDLAEMQAQHDALADLLRSEGVEVVYLEGVDGGRFKSVFTRDSSFTVKGGAIVARLAPRMRHGEERPVTQTLAKMGMPILRTINGTGMIEGGSFAWLNSRTAVVGRGIRVNDEAIQQVAEVLAYQGVELIDIDLRGFDIHIDGHFLMVDVDLALVWPRGLPFSFLEWVVNGLAVSPGRVIMPRGLSEQTREALIRHGTEILEIDYDKLHLNGGGIHCSTCPLIRDSVD